MTAPIVGDHAISVAEEEQHLRIPIVRGEWPAVAEHDRLPATPIFVVNLHAIRGCDSGHVLLPRLSGSRASGREQLPDTAQECDRENEGRQPQSEMDEVRARSDGLAIAAVVGAATDGAEQRAPEAADNRTKAVRHGG